jgi:hypothetical protein
MTHADLFGLQGNFATQALGLNNPPLMDMSDLVLPDFLASALEPLPVPPVPGTALVPLCDILDPHLCTGRLR